MVNVPGKPVSNFLRRFQNPIVVGVVNRHKRLPDNETVLVTLSGSFQRSADPKTASGARIIAFPRQTAEHMSLRRPFLIVCSPVNFRRNPDERSGIVALPLTMETTPPKLRAA